MWAESREEASERVLPSHWYDGDPFAREIATEARRERLKRTLIADPFDQHNRPDIGSGDV